MSVRILQGTVFDRLPEIEPGSIDCAVTSPPYWALRSYLPKGHPLKHLELGSEKTPGEFVANMVRVFGLVKTCLADHATCWLNIGDSYSAGGWECRRVNKVGTGSMDPAERKRSDPYGIDAGNLCLIPQRLMIALQDDGWIVRSIIIWHKPAPMPASIAGWRWMQCRVKVGNVKPGEPGWNKSFSAAPGGYHECGRSHADHVEARWQDCPGCPKCRANAGLVLRRGSWRPTSSYEPILMLAKTADYFSDGEPNKTPASAATVSRDQYTRVLEDPDEQFAVRHDHETTCDAGANARDVQRWAAEPLKEAHYAAFPVALAMWCLRAGTSAHGYCVTCGKPWVRIVEGEKTFQSGSGKSGNEINGKNGAALQGGGDTGDIRKGPVTETRTVGWRPSCQCPDNTPRPGRVLDPFAGSGRTGIACQRMGLDFTGCELNPEYASMAERLLRENMPLFA